MSKESEREPGLSLRPREWELLERARVLRGWPFAADLVTILERLGRTRHARLVDANYRTGFDERGQRIQDLEQRIATMRQRHDADLSRLANELRRVKEERDDHRQAARNETARRMAMQRTRGAAP